MNNNKMLQHPCYSSRAHHKYYRLHLPVAPKCNLGCNYCEKCIGGMSYHSYRPATAKEILSADEALTRLQIYSKNVDNIKVVGIAGPGEPLSNTETFETLELVKKYYSDMTLCLSTNGILLSHYIEKIKELSIDSISITINSFNLETIKTLYAHVYTSDMRKLVADEAANYIRKKQMEGIEALSKNGIHFKVNTILIPGINDNEIKNIAKTIAEYGAKLHNIIPFIPLGKLSHIRKPTEDELQYARKISENYIKQFRHCKQCPSDAFDIPGCV
jgi:nitrogen fixation protein NifB